jgi:hypothetical protein
MGLVQQAVCDEQCRATDIPPALLPTRCTPCCGVVCCRQTALIVTSQLGRPIHTRQFRPKSLESAAAAAGWSPSYMQGPEDLEAERLFDYGMLAPFESRECHAGRLQAASSAAIHRHICRTYSLLCYHP